MNGRSLTMQTAAALTGLMLSALVAGAAESLIERRHHLEDARAIAAARHDAGDFQRRRIHQGHAHGAARVKFTSPRVRGERRRPSDAVLDVKNADPKDRLCERSEARVRPMDGPNNPARCVMRRGVRVVEGARLESV